MNLLKVTTKKVVRLGVDDTVTTRKRSWEYWGGKIFAVWGAGGGLFRLAPATLIMSEPHPVQLDFWLRPRTCGCNVWCCQMWTCTVRVDLSSVLVTRPRTGATRNCVTNITSTCRLRTATVATTSPRNCSGTHCCESAASSSSSSSSVLSLHYITLEFWELPTWLLNSRKQLGRKWLRKGGPLSLGYWYPFLLNSRTEKKLNFEAFLENSECRVWACTAVACFCSVFTVLHVLWW